MHHKCSPASCVRVHNDTLLGPGQRLSGIVGVCFCQRGCWCHQLRTACSHEMCFTSQARCQSVCVWCHAVYSHVGGCHDAGVFLSSRWYWKAIIFPTARPEIDRKIQALLSGDGDDDSKDGVNQAAKLYLAGFTHHVSLRIVIVSCTTWVVQEECFHDASNVHPTVRVGSTIIHMVRAGLDKTWWLLLYC